MKTAPHHAVAILAAILALTIVPVSSAQAAGKLAFATQHATAEDEVICYESGPGKDSGGDPWVNCEDKAILDANCAEIEWNSEYCQGELEAVNVPNARGLKMLRK